MNIIIAGAGKVGYTVARQLAADGHDVSIIDSDRERLDKAMNAMDVIGFCGNAANPSVLEEAEVRRADVFIAATSADEINLVSCQFAKKMGAGHTMARIRSPEYMDRIELMREMMDLALALNPDQVAAEEISRVLQFPSATRIEVFPGCEFELVTARVSADSRLQGVPLTDMERRFGSRVLICAVERNGEIAIPKGDFVLREGDVVTITGTHNNLRKFFTSAGSYKKPVKTVTLLGGSRIAVYLAMLLRNTGVDVTIIEIDPARARYLAEILPDADIVCADGTDTSALAETGLDRADGFVALTNYDEDNIILSMYADKLGVDKVICKVNNQRFTDLLGSAFQDTTVTPKELMAQRILGFVRALSNSSELSTMEALYYLGEGRITAAEFVAGPGARCVGKPLKELRLRKDVLLSCVVRGGVSYIPDGRTVIEPGDLAVVITTDRAIRTLDEILLEGGAG